MGGVCELPASESIAILEREVVAARSYSRVYHELVLMGICPACPEKAPPIVCAKVQARMRRTGRLKSMDRP